MMLEVVSHSSMNCLECKAQTIVIDIVTLEDAGNAWKWAEEPLWRIRLTIHELHDLTTSVLDLINIISYQI